ncbi:MAG TPA: ATP-binding protein, partial [Actinomycetota bacterium]|nr:ATP-binding protein [Actinomycetota bacterium]
FRHPLMAGYLLSFTFVAVAALHPSMPAFTEEVLEGKPARRLWRLALLGASALVAPAILISEALERSFQHVVPLALLSAILFLLVLARVGQLFSDLRARKETEARLREAERNYRDLVEQLPGVVYTADPGPEGRWTYVSPQITEMLGYTPEEWMADPTLWAQRLHPDDRERVVSAEETLLEQEAQQPHDEYRMVARDGRVVWVRDDATLMRGNIGDKSAFFRGLLFDITDRKVLEDQLRQSQKMEAIGLLAGGISHDFNNLLAIIRNYASFVAEEVPVTDPKHQDLQEVIKAATRGAQLTRQLLTFSRRDVVQPRVLDLNEVVSDMHKMLSRTIPATVQLTTSLAPNLWSTKIDPGQIEQILMNLAVNAKDAMPGGGRVTIVTANAEIQTPGSDPGPKVPPGDYVTLSVADTGSGMSKQVLERIFEPFSTTKPKGQGTGLGLATVYGIVEQAGGHITADSEVGRGTTFTVYLPRTHEEVLDQSHVDAQATTGTGRAQVILVAEDEDAVRELVVRILRKNGHTVLSAPNGVEAIRTAQSFRGRIDLLLSDVVMPDVSGREVSERTRLPTLYMSGYPDEILTDEGVDAPREAVLEKPFSAEDLINAVRAALAGAPTDALLRRARAD